MSTRPLKDELFDLQDGLCWICHQPMKLGTRPCHPLAPSVDHVVPLSKGGKNHPSNKLLAHVRCNGRRGNQMPKASPWAAVMALRFGELNE
jgi:5-methylcytosine-specific restriction endonuclease McrA